MTRDDARIWLDPKYPNLAAILIGCVSGRHTEWPAMKPELVRLVEAINDQREEIRLLSEQVGEANQELLKRAAEIERLQRALSRLRHEVALVIQILHA